MFSEATRRIHVLEQNDRCTNSRISACENEIYKINHERYTDTSIWERISNAECNINELTNRIDQLAYEVKVLQCQLEEIFSATRAALDEKTVNPNKKSDLEILEENGKLRLDPYITPLYYIDDEY